MKDISIADLNELLEKMEFQSNELDKTVKALEKTNLIGFTEKIQKLENVTKEIEIYADVLLKTIRDATGREAAKVIKENIEKTLEHAVKGFDASEITLALDKKMQVTIEATENFWREQELLGRKVRDTIELLQQNTKILTFDASAPAIFSNAIAYIKQENELRFQELHNRYSKKLSYFVLGIVLISGITLGIAAPFALEGYKSLKADRQTAQQYQK